MKPWPVKIERLRKYVLWECKDIPPDLVLAIINNESGGKIGIEGRVKTRAGKLADVNGNLHNLNHAMGLMQVIPATVNWYNQSAPEDEKATVEDMQGDDERAARMQIRVGCKFLAFVNHYLHRKEPQACPAKSLSEAGDSQTALVATGYAVGHGATRKKLKSLVERGISPTFSNVKKHFPTWGQNKNGRWINRPIFYATKILTNFKKHRGGSFEETSPTDLAKRAVGQLTSGKGVIAAAIFTGGLAWLIHRHFGKPRGKE